MLVLINNVKAFLAERPSLTKYVFLAIIFLAFVFLFSLVPPEGVDWRLGFYQVAKNPTRPYETGLFINPPWIALLLFPFRYFSQTTSLAINTSLNLMMIGLLVFERKGSPLSIFLALTSYPFMSMIANGNIEWVLALGFILQNKWSVPLLLLKPQVGFLSILSWDSFRRNGLLFFVPSIFVVLASFVIWGNWVPDMLANVRSLQSTQGGMSWNVSLFPWSIPIGLLLVFLIVKYRPADSEILGILATLCLVPYFAVYSLGILYALISVSHKRIAVVLWFLLWLYPFLHH